MKALGALAMAVVLVGVAVLAAFVLFAMAMGASPAQACGPGAPVPSSVDVDPATLEAVNALKPLYEQAAQATGLHWAMLAAVDYRENGNSPNQSALSGEPIGTANPDNPGVTTSSKEDSLVRAGEHLRAMASSVYGVELSAASADKEVQLAFLAYNRGYIYQRAGAGPDVSPYVMNQADAAHIDMAWPNIAGEPLAGRTEYGRYGAWTLFTRLGGGASANCAGLSNLDVVAIAQQQVGLREVPDGCNCGPEIQQFLGSSPGEQWCADFVSWVYNQAGQPFTGGQDGGWRLPGVAGVHRWLAEHAIWHDRGDGDLPLPGDVIVFRGDEHIGIVEAVEGETVKTIEGNSSNAVSRRTYDSYATNGQITGWGRMAAAQ